MRDGKIAVIGENVADIIIEPSDGVGNTAMRVFSGGGPANTAVALGRLGAAICFVGRVSHDAIGGLFTERLSQSCVDLSLSLWTNEPAALAFASIDSVGNAQYAFYVSGAADWNWSVDDLNTPALRQSVCIHTGSLALAMMPGGGVLEDILRQMRSSSTISLDPNVRTSIVRPELYRRKAKRWAQLADIIRLNDEDLEVMVDLSGYGSIDAVFDEWHGEGVSLIVLTRGNKSVLASLHGARLEIPVADVAVVDTIGAGDSFTAGLLYSLDCAGLLGGRLTTASVDAVQTAIHFGTSVAGFTCRSAGATAPWAHELDR